MAEPSPPAAAAEAPAPAPDGPAEDPADGGASAAPGGGEASGAPPPAKRSRSRSAAAAAAAAETPRSVAAQAQLIAAQQAASLYEAASRRAAQRSAATESLVEAARVAASRSLPGLTAALGVALSAVDAERTGSRPPPTGASSGGPPPRPPTPSSSSSSAAAAAAAGGAAAPAPSSSSSGAAPSAAGGGPGADLARRGHLPPPEAVRAAAAKAVLDHPPYVHLSTRDAAPQLRITDGAAGRRLAVRGGMRGYRMARATHGFSSGTYYYEVTVLPPPGAREVVGSLPDVVRLGEGLRENLTENLVAEEREREGGGAKPAPPVPKRQRRALGTPENFDAAGLTGHLRLGWSMRTGDLQAPVGYDRWSYGFRDILGSRIHRSRREDRWGGEPFGPGDVMGVCLHLVGDEAGEDGAAPAANHIRLFKNGRALGEFVISRGNQVGGEAFRSVTPGVYYPALSSYMGGSATVNFGPHFVHPPPRTLPGGIRPAPVSDLCPPPPDPSEVAAAATKERAFPKRADEAVVRAFREAVECEARIRHECYLDHASRHVEEVRKERELRGVSTADLPEGRVPPGEGEGGEGGGAAADGAGAVGA